MILVDTSAWIEFLRDTGSVVCEEVDRLLAAEIAVCDPIRMEVLSDTDFDVLARHTALEVHQFGA